MDVNWCTYCDKQLLDQTEDSESSECEEAASQLAASRKHIAGASQQKNKPSSSKILTKTRRPASSNKVSKSKGVTHCKNGTSGISIQDAVKSSMSKRVSDAELKPWKNLYCSAECMAKDEQRSRLAIANLDFSPMAASTSQLLKPDSAQSSSHQSLPSLPSDSSRPNSPAARYSNATSTRPVEPARRDYAVPFMTPVSPTWPHTSSGRRHRPTSMTLSSSSHRSNRSGSEASSSYSRGNSSPIGPTNNSSRFSRTSGLRSLIQLDEHVELGQDMYGRNQSPFQHDDAHTTEAEMPNRALNRNSLEPFPSMPRPHSLDHSAISVPAAAVRSGSMPNKNLRRHSRGLSLASMKSNSSHEPSSGTLAAPVLSQGVEGSASGILLGSPRDNTSTPHTAETEDRRLNNNSRQRPPSMAHFLRLRTYSSTSVQQYPQHSPSSNEADFSLSDGQSASSSASSPPSEQCMDYLNCKKLSNSSLHVFNPHSIKDDGTVNTTLQDYGALFQPRSARSPGISGLGSSSPSRMSPRPTDPSTFFSRHPASSSQSTRMSAVFDSLRPGAANTSTTSPEPTKTAGSERADNLSTTRARLSGIKSSASVASLPHQVQVEEGPSTLRASSMPKNHWKWDASTLQYPVMRSSKDVIDEKRKRLFYFDGTDTL